MRAIIRGVTYYIKGSDFSDTSGPQDPSITNSYTILRTQWDNTGYGVLNDLGGSTQIDTGTDWGYRLVLRGNRGEQVVTNLKRSEVEIIPDA